MCKFLSAIVMANGDVICHPEYTDSHEVLIKAYNLKTSDVAERSYVRVEFVPQGEYDDLDNYKLSVDEPSTPDWFESIRNEVTENLRLRLGRAISIAKDHATLLGQFAIIRDWKCEVYCGRVFLLGNAQATLRGNAQATLWDNAQATERREYSWDNPTVIDKRDKEASNA